MASGISEESSGVPTPFPVATGSGTGAVQPVIVGVSESGTFSVTLDVPAGLTVGDRSFTGESESIGADGLVGAASHRCQ